MRATLRLVGFACAIAVPAATLATVFNFDNGPVNTGTPLDQVADGITAHFSHEGSNGYAIWAANVWGFTPAGFSGYSLWPASVYRSDLYISFSVPISSISMLYAPDELATDSSCTMRITGFLNGTLVGTATHQNPNPGTWPTDTLSLTGYAPFDSVTVHYESPPPTGGDYGEIFAIDNIQVTPVPEPASLGAIVLGLASLLSAKQARRR